MAESSCYKTSRTLSVSVSRRVIRPSSSHISELTCIICLIAAQKHSELVAEVVYSWILPGSSQDAVPSATDGQTNGPAGANVVPM